MTISLANTVGPDVGSSVYVYSKQKDRIDDAGLMAGLESDAFYLGAMGSVRTSARRLERLQRIAEASQVQLARIHAPIGLPIGSKTPIEIAIAVLAEVIAVRQGIRLRDATDAA